MVLADTLAEHPKIVLAGTLLGVVTGRSEALAMYVAAIGYSRHYITDGFISDAWISELRWISSGEAVAKALSAPRVCLWKRVKGGYRIHDFHHWNAKASDIKQKRLSERQRLAAHRTAKRNGHV